MKCPEAIKLMHAYLDDDIDEYSHHELLLHIKTCQACKLHFNELKMTDNLLKQLPQKRSSNDCIEKVLQQIPNKSKEFRVKKWLKRYPYVVAASIFLFLFSVSMASYMAPNNDQFRIVSGDRTNLVINGNEVIVPEGQEILGDLVIENGNLKIKGEVKGNVTVINGEILMASASQVDGHTKQVDQIFEKLWYQIKSLFYNF